MKNLGGRPTKPKRDKLVALIIRVLPRTKAQLEREARARTKEEGRKVSVGEVVREVCEAHTEV